MVILALLYGLFGAYVPGEFQHGGLDPTILVQQLYQSTLGIWGFITGVSASVVAVFVIFGSLLLVSGGGQTFIDIAIKIAGRMRGGPPLVGVLSSALFGTICGSGPAIVAVTGTFTIPLMKNLGYRSHFAGAVEATAATGGQIMPPVMGAGAFVMAELLGISYVTVCAAAAIPAVLYFLAVGFSSRAEAIRLNLPPVPAEKIPTLRSIVSWRRLGPLFIPIIALIVPLIKGWSPTTCGLLACMAGIVLFMLTDFSPRRMLGRGKVMIDALEDGAKSLVPIVALMVCANIIVGMITATGAALKISEGIIGVSGANSLVALILAAAVALVLGMGLPTTAAYVLCASVCAPALDKLGIDPLVANMFIFYYALLAAITPPICATVFVAAAIAKADWLKISWEACKLAGLAFLMPFIFAYMPQLLMMGERGEVIRAAICGVAGAVFFSSGVTGCFTFKLSVVPRILAGVGGVLLLIPKWQTQLVGIIMVALVFLPQLLRKRTPQKGISSISN